jgi:hypothetical protein
MMPVNPKSEGYTVIQGLLEKEIVMLCAFIWLVNQPQTFVTIVANLQVLGRPEILLAAEQLSLPHGKLCYV